MAIQEMFETKFQKIGWILLISVVIIAVIYYNRTTLCDCQKSWEFLYLGYGNHKVNLYGAPGETFQTIDEDGTNHFDELEKCLKKYGNSYKNTGFKSHPEWKGCE